MAASYWGVWVKRCAGVEIPSGKSKISYAESEISTKVNGICLYSCTAAAGKVNGIETVATAAGNKNYKLHSRVAGTSETLILTKPLIIEFFP
jgi:hypothetical protein